VACAGRYVEAPEYVEGLLLELHSLLKITRGEGVVPESDEDLPRSALISGLTEQPQAFLENVPPAPVVGAEHLSSA
jgi:hypothetical protein